MVEMRFWRLSGVSAGSGFGTCRVSGAVRGLFKKALILLDEEDEPMEEDDLMEADRESGGVSGEAEDTSGSGAGVEGATGGFLLRKRPMAEIWGRRWTITLVWGSL